MEFVCYFFDILAHKILNTCHSRDNFQRRFVVDEKSAVGMNIRDKSSFDLLESIESCQMILNLSSSKNISNTHGFLSLQLTIVNIQVWHIFTNGKNK